MKVQYSTLRTIHLVCAAFSLPALLMYGVSAVQMAHSKWFNMKPSVTETDIRISAGLSDGRSAGRELMAASPNIRGEITAVQATPVGLNLRIVVPGTVHEIRYDRAAGSAHVRTSVAGFMGMLNRLHHAAGVFREYGPLKLWAVLVGIVSMAVFVMGATGVWMWWLRKQDRLVGLILVSANLVFVITILMLIRSTGP